VNSALTNVQLECVQPDQLERVIQLLEGSELYTSSVTFASSSYWIALFDGLDVGCVGLEHGFQASLLRSMAVSPQFRSSGIGRTLALFALEQARKRGDRAVYLFTSDMGPFWTRFGFAEVPLERLVQALPDVPQVQSALNLDWLEESRAWLKSLEPQEV
jgi:N-acetylglutamate synthase-like GNAT family acetyltransferase